MARSELPDQTYRQVLRFSKNGDNLAKKGKFRDAIAEYNNAWELLPEPRRQWNASIWLLAAILDAAFLGGFFKTARKALDDAMSMEESIGNPFLHLRNGQVYFEEGHLDKASEHLMLAYMAEGKDIFREDNPKYYEFLKTRARDLE
jgi:tetratricopeptide (TPR) repeat protein